MSSTQNEVTPELENDANRLRIIKGMLLNAESPWLNEELLKFIREIVAGIPKNEYEEVTQPEVV